MAINYRDYKYFDNRPDVVRVFRDLEDFHDFCRFEMCEFDPANLYRKSSYIYREYLKWKRFGANYQSHGQRRRKQRS